MGISKIDCKLGNMRKVVDWVVYPIDPKQPDVRIIQCDKRICKLDLTTKKGVLSKSQNYPAFITLSPMLGSTPIDIPDDVIAMLKADNTAVGSVLLSPEFVQKAHDQVATQ